MEGILRHAVNALVGGTDCRCHGVLSELLLIH